MKILSVDLGKARTGIAVSDETEFIASPVCVIEETDFEKLLYKIKDIIIKLGAKKIVLGLPKNMDGSEGESAINAREFGEKLNEVTYCEVIMWDERNSTVSAHNYLNTANKKGKKRKQIIDSVAAVIILQNYLDFKKNVGETFLPHN